MCLEISFLLSKSSDICVISNSFKSSNGVPYSSKQISEISRAERNFECIRLVTKAVLFLREEFIVAAICSSLRSFLRTNKVDNPKLIDEDDAMPLIIPNTKYEERYNALSSYF
ncbi:hypothetical protein GCM10009347_34520 [Shewanella algicola]|nr:hypothetical protein GCM10009347_34520 [Shewanella algicola]